MDGIMIIKAIADDNRENQDRCEAEEDLTIAAWVFDLCQKWRLPFLVGSRIDDCR
jgi:hypothetical protein